MVKREIKAESADFPLVVKWKLLMDDIQAKKEKGEEIHGCGYSF